MTQRQVFPKEKIVETAFELIREAGWNAVTARAIAARLGASTMPIYTSLKSMGGIENEVRRKAEDLMAAYQKKPFTDNPALNVAVGYVAFAREEPELFRFLFFDRPVPVHLEDLSCRADGFEARFADVRGIREQMAQLLEGDKDPVVLKSWIFTHGLASMVGSGLIEITQERLQELLLEAGGSFYLWERQKKEGSLG